MAELFDMVLAWGRVLATQVSATTKAVLVDVAGPGGGRTDVELLALGMKPAGNTCERATGEVLYGQLGVIARPRPPNREGIAEVLTVRTSDGLTPIAARDTRTSARYPAPKDGDVAVVHDAGGFVSFTDNGDKVAMPPPDPPPDPAVVKRVGLPKGTTVALYAPKLTDLGAVDRAHALALDTSESNESVSLVHALGMALLMTKEKVVILKNAAGDAYIQIDDDGVTINGNTKLNGGVVFGDAPTAVPVLVASAAQALWLTQVTTALGQIAAYVNGIAPGTVTPVAAPPPAPTTKLSASP